MLAILTYGAVRRVEVLMEERSKKKAPVKPPEHGLPEVEIENPDANADDEVENPNKTPAKDLPPNSERPEIEDPKIRKRWSYFSSIARLSSSTCSFKLHKS